MPLSLAIHPPPKKKKTKKKQQQQETHTQTRVFDCQDKNK